MKKSSFYSMRILLIFLLCSCTSMNKITYLNKKSQQLEWNLNPKPPKHYIEEGDNLVVKIYVNNEEINNSFNLESNTNSSNPNTTAANLYLNGYTVSNEGYIELPYVGKINVKNLTIDEAKMKIERKVSEQLVEPVVIVKLSNIEFTILGEVESPGRYPIYKENLTIFEAIASAGDITDYGNLKKVKLIRSGKESKDTYDIDLTSDDILNSNFYYLRNKDLIYIQPLRFKSFRKTQSQVILSTLTTVAVLLNVYLRFEE